MPATSRRSSEVSIGAPSSRATASASEVSSGTSRVPKTPRSTTSVPHKPPAGSTSMATRTMRAPRASSERAARECFPPARRRRSMAVPSCAVIGTGSLRPCERSVSTTTARSPRRRTTSATERTTWRSAHRSRHSRKAWKAPPAIATSNRTSVSGRNRVPAAIPRLPGEEGRERGVTRQPNRKDRERAPERERQKPFTCTFTFRFTTGPTRSSEIQIPRLFLLLLFLVLAFLFVEELRLGSDGGRFIIRRRKILAVHLERESELAPERRHGGEHLLERRGERLDLIARCMRAATRAPHRRIAAQVGDLDREGVLALLALELELHRP